MRVTQKGQVTIPKPLRDELGITEGTEVVFEHAGDTLVLRKVAGSERGRRLSSRMRGRGDVALSTDEIMALTRRRGKGSRPSSTATSSSTSSRRMTGGLNGPREPWMRPRIAVRS